jgi:peptidoglycan hydrolase-like protein with peptidoglycan-binding domain
MEFHRQSIFSFVFLAALTLLPSFVIAATFTRPLVVGSQGTDVSALQQILKSRGYFTGDVTGYFGLLTAKSLAKLQTANGIEALGGVGPKTRTLLNSISGGSSSNPNQALIDALLGQVKILQAKIAELLAANGLSSG